MSRGTDHGALVEIAPNQFSKSPLRTGVAPLSVNDQDLLYPFPDSTPDKIVEYLRGLESGKPVKVDRAFDRKIARRDGTTAGGESFLREVRRWRIPLKPALEIAPVHQCAPSTHTADSGTHPFTPAVVRISRNSS
jgi:hypothetical protein